jgi:hypothetical protein
VVAEEALGGWAVAPRAGKSEGSSEGSLEAECGGIPVCEDTAWHWIACQYAGQADRQTARQLCVYETGRDTLDCAAILKVR